jgi:hypothetical protein
MRTTTTRAPATESVEQLQLVSATPGAVACLFFDGLDMIGLLLLLGRPVVHP